MEEWRVIEGYPDYQVSNYGQVKSFKQDRVNGKLLKIHIDDNGYPFVACFGEQGKRKFKISRLVAQEFIPNPENLVTVDHVDRNKQNNYASNLRWASYKTQAQNRDFLNMAKGENNNKTILNEAQVIEIKKLRLQGWGKRKIAKALDITPNQAQSGIVNWKYLE